MKKPDSPILVRPLKLWQDQTNEQEVRLEILPLIDVIFCILTFFILAAVSFSKQQAINLNLPSARTGQPQLEETIVVSLDELGQVYVEQEKVTSEELSQAVKNYYLLNPEGIVVLNAAREVRYNEVVELLDVLRTFGGDRVALATLPLEGAEIPTSDSSLPIYSPLR
ncbi:biopolymer transporter ExbD [Gloeocapsa sp. PCC 73106]|uniref:ExbD/TolR family protein n=1 Tax=Gloeocapsa sp. PCC 73106 TaxID=102232 RepID=UPI0002ABDD1B|nr:biopolymer transporter ExbD [Gloeocapsa sp. PCC 73106]ELR97146.1 biopolymer transport protein [Gloeocapsa sp. PCC 73106]